MQGSVGWICPKCSAIISPYDQTCAKCAPKPTIGLGTLYVGGGYGTYSGWSGTITFGGTSTAGTPKPDPRDKELKEVRSQLSVLRDWRDKVIELRDELDELIEEVSDDEDD